VGRKAKIGGEKAKIGGEKAKIGGEIKTEKMPVRPLFSRLESLWITLTQNIYKTC